MIWSHGQALFLSRFSSYLSATAPLLASLVLPPVGLFCSLGLCLSESSLSSALLCSAGRFVLVWVMEIREPSIL